MPIAGVVISAHPNDVNIAVEQLTPLSGVDIHGSDQQGNIVAVLEAASSAELEELMQRINRQESILHVGLTYLNVEDEQPHACEAANSNTQESEE